MNSVVDIEGLGFICLSAKFIILVFFLNRHQDQL